MASYALLEQARHLQALVLDVDGILSDGFVTLTNTGDEIKSFDIRDGLGMKLAQQAGMKVIIITGRKVISLKTHVRFRCRSGVPRP